MPQEHVRIACQGALEVKLEKLNELQGELKSLSTENYEKLKAEILGTGFAFPIRAWKDPKGKLWIVGGHQAKRTLERMESEGYVVPPLPVSLIAADSMKEARRRVLQDVTQYGKVERQGLYEFMSQAELTLQDVETAFSVPELDLKSFQVEYFQDNTVAPGPEPKDTGPKELPKEAKTKPGDLWILGNHRLLCGDATRIDQVERLMGGQKADCVFTDPPYNIGYKPGRGTHDAIANDDMDPEDFAQFLADVMGSLIAVTKENTFAFIWSRWSEIEHFAPVIKRFYQVKAMPIWVKNQIGNGWFARARYEVFFLCARGEAPKPMNCPPDVWEHARVVDKIHSCEKPVVLIKDILTAYVPQGSVLDLFGGSGATMMACEEMRRPSFTMELDAKYCDAILARYAKSTGRDPILEDGTKWSSISA